MKQWLKAGVFLARKTKRSIGWQLFIAATVFCFAVPIVVAQTDHNVPDLIAKLESSEVPIRRDAARTLSRIGSQAQPAVAGLAKALVDKDRQVCSHALAALSQLGPLAKDATPQLIEALQSKHTQVRYRAAHALSRVGPTAVPALIEALQSDSVPQRLGAAKALAWIGIDARAAMNVLLKALTDVDEGVREEVAQALGSIGIESVERLLDILPTEDINVRCGALRVFEIVGPKAQTAIPTIKKLVTGDDPAVRVCAARALTYVGVSTAELVPILGELLADAEEDVNHTASELLLLVRPQEATIELLTEFVEVKDVDTVVRAARLLGSLGEVADSAVPALVRATARLGEQDTAATLPEALGTMHKSAVRGILTELSGKEHSQLVLRRYVNALEMVGSEAIPLLVEALGAPQPQVRSVAALTLGTMGASVTDVVPKMIALLADPEAQVRAHTAEAVGGLGTVARDATPLLANLLDDEDSSVRAAAVVALGETAVDPTEHASLFVQAFNDKQANVRVAAASVVGQNKGLASTTVDALVVALSDQDEKVRAGAALGLATASEAGAEGGPNLIACLQDPVAVVRANAAQALGAIGKPNSKRLEALGATLEDESADVRRQVVMALRKLGPAASSVVPRLVEALEHKNSDFRILVVESFRPIISNIDELLKPLLQATHDSDREVKRAAAYEIGEIGPAAQDAVPRLFLMIEDDVDRYAASAAVAKISPKDVQLLIEKMKNESPFVRRAACDALNNLGTDAMPALDFLQEQLADKKLREEASRKQDYGIRRCVEETVKKLTKKDTT